MMEEREFWNEQRRGWKAMLACTTDPNLRAAIGHMLASIERRCGVVARQHDDVEAEERELVTA